MNTNLKYLLAFLLLLGSADIIAQVRTGQMVGFNFSNMKLNAGGSPIEAQGATGIHYGLIFSIPASENFAFQPGIIFSAKGSSFLLDTLDISLSPIYLEVPLNLILSFGRDAFGVTFFTGAYFSYGIGGTKIVSGGEAKEIAYGSGDSKDLKHFDIGLNFGAGFNIRGFLITAQYGLGLANLSPTASNSTEMQNRVIGISLTTLFAGR
jgi:hypothetical protein